MSFLQDFVSQVVIRVSTPEGRTNLNRLLDQHMLAETIQFNSLPEELRNYEDRFNYLILHNKLKEFLEEINKNE